MTNCFEIVATCPKGRQPRFQFRKFFSEYSRCVSLELLDDIVGGFYGRSFHKKMNVIGHHFHILDGYSKLTGFVLKQFFKSCFDIANQDFSTIFGTPNDMVRNVIYRLIASCPTFIIHTGHYTPGRSIIQVERDS